MLFYVLACLGQGTSYPGYSKIVIKVLADHSFKITMLIIN